MAWTQERLAHGMTYDAYKAQMTCNRERLMKNECPVKICDMLQTLVGDLWAADPAFTDVAPDTPFPRLPEEAQAHLLHALNQFRTEMHDLADREVVRELRALVEPRLAHATRVQAGAITR